jgi:hypothetical protein
LSYFASSSSVALPNSAFEGQAVTGLIGMFSTAFQFFPADVWILALGSITFWITVHAVYGLVNFILRLIPIINIGQ